MADGRAPWGHLPVGAAAGVRATASFWKPAAWKVLFCLCVLSATAGPSPRGGSPQKGFMRKLYFFNFFIGTFFLNKLGLGAKNTSFRPTNRIPRQILRIHSYSEVHRSTWWSKCQEVNFFERNIENFGAEQLLSHAFITGPGRYREVGET